MGRMECDAGRRCAEMLLMLFRVEAGKVLAERAVSLGQRLGNHTLTVRAVVEITGVLVSVPMGITVCVAYNHQQKRNS